MPEARQTSLARRRTRATASSIVSKGAMRTLKLAVATGGSTLWAVEPCICVKA